MKKKSKNAIILAVLVNVTVLLNFFSIYNRGYLSYNGVAVDREGNVYISTDSEIVVYDKNSRFLYRIAQVPRGFNFTIKDDVLYMKNSDYVAICTKTGEVVDLIYYSENDNLPDYMRYSYNDRKQPYVSENGDVYKLLKIDGLRLSVMKNGDTVVYIESWTPAILRFAAKVSIAITVGFFIYLAADSEKMRPVQNPSDKKRESK